MKKLLTPLLMFLMILALAIPALAADYNFGSGNGTIADFGTSTGTDKPVTQNQMNDNIRRNKDAALLPPPFGIFSGDIPTDPSSHYHNNLSESGFVPTGQNLPPVGNEDYAPGSSDVSTGLLPSTSQASDINTMPWYYEDGTIGSLYISRTGKTVKIYEGEDLSNLAKGAGHFSSTSAWDGNVALAGHNRGSSPYFSFVKDLRNGDTLTYTTRYGTRKYKVISKTLVSEMDSSSLSWSAENTLTLITCVTDVPEMRYSVVAQEIK